MPARSKRKKEPEHQSHERWLVSYADFITLLFAFFVVMFATSQVNKKKVTWIAAYFAAYIKGGNAGAAEVLRDLPANFDEVLPPKPSAEDAAMAQLAPVHQQLSQELTQEIGEGKVALSMQPRGLVLSLREAALFPPGQDTFNPEALPILSKVAAALSKLPRQPVRLEGHSDNIPIETGRFPSNWELSAARANVVLELFCGRFELQAERFAVAGYADYRPVSANDTSEGRASNRRVDIVILSGSAAEMEPHRRKGDG